MSYIEMKHSYKRYQTGETEKELLNIAIPSIPLFRQDYLIQRYKQGLNDYKRKIARAEQEWERIQNDIRQQLS